MKNRNVCDFSDVFFYEEITPLEDLLHITKVTNDLDKKLQKTFSFKIRDDLFHKFYSLGTGLIRFGIFREGIKCFESSLELLNQIPPQQFVDEAPPDNMNVDFLLKFCSVMNSLTVFYFRSQQFKKLDKMIKQNILINHNPHLSELIDELLIQENIRSFCLKLRKKDAFKNLIGVSGEWYSVLVKVYRIAKSNEPVLIVGPSGVGKEVVAKAIHVESGRKNFVAVNCAAIPDGLINSELFGAERGAYTGAIAQQIGLCEKAEDGTFFLDEIGISSLNFQKSLLRLIQEKEFMRLGGRKTIKFTGRIIAATNRDIPTLIKEKVFLEDLYWRLNVHEISIPPLWSRTLDIDELIFYFMTNSDIKKKISYEAVQAISDYYEQREVEQEVSKIATDIFDKRKAAQFAQKMDINLNFQVENNVRELKNYISRFLYETDDDDITLNDLPSRIAEARLKGLPRSEIYHIPESAVSEKCIKKDLERALLITNGNQTKAAALFRCTPQAINQKVKKFKIKLSPK